MLKSRINMPKEVKKEISQWFMTSLTDEQLLAYYTFYITQDIFKEEEEVACFMKETMKQEILNRMK